MVSGLWPRATVWYFPNLMDRFFHVLMLLGAYERVKCQVTPNPGVAKKEALLIAYSARFLSLRS